MAETRRKKPARKAAEAPQLHREMWGIIFLGFALLLGGALLSLQFGDGRLMGPFGQALALGLFSLLGLGSHLVVVALFSVAWGIFSRRFSVKDGRLWLGYTGATLCGTVLFSLIFSRYRLQGMGAGGKTGELLGALGISLLSKAGTFIFFVMGLLLFLMLATQSSPARAIVGLVEGTQALFVRLGRLFTGIGRFFVSLFSWEPLEEDEPAEEEAADDAEDEAAEAHAAEAPAPKKVRIKAGSPVVAATQDPDTLPMESGLTTPARKAKAPRNVVSSGGTSPATAEASAPETGVASRSVETGCPQLLRMKVLSEKFTTPSLFASPAAV
ncbi:MAG: hypothetical protein CVU59_08450 [Deltaproteobacteria bacterium HGW-Deltaproteobacteria-17]|nr:MAG: hypothetical protein CVU59_08450 [Deltaproteobacteria bacterium HGW-Deltaproteobacteria-17]